MYKKMLFMLVVIIIILILIIYLKKILLYRPSLTIPEKYEKFNNKLIKLTGSRNYVQNYLVETDDNIMLDTVYIKNMETTKSIIFFHGNSGNLSMRFDMIKFLYNYASIIIFDYRSFGRSTGNSFNLSSKILKNDAKTIWNFAISNLGILPKNISLFGESLGCSIAIHLASILSKKMDEQYYPHSLVLNSPFYSLGSMIEYMFSKINIGSVGKLLSLFIGNEYQSNEWIKFINQQTKIIIAHSPRDEIIPYREGQNLFNSIMRTHPNAKFVNITGTHNNLGLTDNYIYALADIFND